MSGRKPLERLGGAGGRSPTAAQEAHGLWRRSCGAGVLPSQGACSPWDGAEGAAEGQDEGGQG